MTTKVTRQQLHALVWTKPITKLALDFGISDVALHKICRKARVPTPPAGHWMKVEYGKRTIITPLPDPADEAEVSVRGGAAAHEPTSVATARTAVLARIPVENSTAPTPAIVKRTLQCLRKAKRDGEGLVRCSGADVISVTAIPESVSRVGEVLSRLVRAGEGIDLSLVETSAGSAWLCDGQTISFELVEAADQLEHVATKQELAAVAKWQRERDERHQRYGYWSDYGEPRIPKWEQHYRGRLAIKLEQVRLRSESNWWGETMPRTFADSRTRDVLRMVPRIIAAVAAIAAAKHSNAELEQRQRAAAQEAERRRAEQERKRVDEARAMKLLSELVERAGEIQRLEALLSLLHRSPKVALERTDKFIGWAEERLTTLRRTLSAEAIEDRLVAERLFAANSA